MNEIRATITKLGGALAVAKALGVSRSTIYAWQCTNDIPAANHPKLQALGKKKNIFLSPADLDPKNHMKQVLQVRTTVKEIVKRFGTPTELAEMLGVSPPAVCNWVRAGYVPLNRHNALLDLAKKRHVSLHRTTLMGQMNQNKPPLVGQPDPLPIIQEPMPPVKAMTPVSVPEQVMVSKGDAYKLVRWFSALTASGVGLQIDDLEKMSAMNLVEAMVDADVYPRRA